MKFHERLFTLLVLLLPFSSCHCPKQGVDTAAKIEALGLGDGSSTFAVAFTTSVHGWVEPCGCTSQPLGGIARLATVIEKAREHYALGTLFIDGGDLLFDSSAARNPADVCQETARVDLLLEGLHDLSLEGTFERPFDNAMGAEFRERRLSQHKVADLTARAREGYVTGAGQFKIGVLLLDGADSASFNSKASLLKSKGADAVIAVSHLSRNETRAIAQGSPSVDVIILAAVAEETPAVTDVVGPNGPFLVSAAKQGQYLGIVEFHRLSSEKEKKWRIDNRKEQRESRAALLSQRKKTILKQIEQTTDEGRVGFLRERLKEIEVEINDLSQVKAEKALTENFIEARAVTLSRKIPSSPVFAARLKNYESQIPALVAQCEVNVDCPRLEENQAKFVGAESCKNCHAAAYDVWKKAIFEMPATDENGKSITISSGHTKAWITLEGKHKTEDRSCVGCHSTGFMQPGGYCKVKEVAFRGNVQCEACHGAGSLHASTGDKRFIKREVPESVCRGCHHVPHIPTTESFVYSEKVQRILGVGHGELLLTKLKHESQAKN